MKGQDFWKLTCQNWYQDEEICNYKRGKQALAGPQEQDANVLFFSSQHKVEEQILVSAHTGCLKKTEFYRIELLEILLPVGKKYF